MVRYRIHFKVMLYVFVVLHLAHHFTYFGVRYSIPRRVIAIFYKRHGPTHINYPMSNLRQ